MLVAWRTPQPVGSRTTAPERVTPRGKSPGAGGSLAMAAPPADALDAGGIQLPVWTEVLGWCGTAGLIYLLICAVSIISRGFAGAGQRRSAQYVRLCCEPLGRTMRGRARHGLHPAWLSRCRRAED